ncbi:electron transport complex subunit RsxG [sulfur-oxidizing endosymbiont of Gigantopelta aegis]|uniref:electron transport complex subunit RsxG n=1 Tax=sulfur-oxidizing endosymbiont of Gigantopelta aegis TaxID=2794934 RepID=UPI001BE43774|nr:electron transport complex subunit RsxG [sulfur-oxidizing endosymbiont of Gigantopelta aegis]
MSSNSTISPMKKTQILRNMIISATLLATFGALGTGLVMVTFEQTKDQIEASEKANLLRNLNNIIPAESYNNNLLDNKLIVPPTEALGKDKNTTIYQAWQDKTPIAIAFSIIAHDGYSGDITLLVAIKENGQISGVRVISHKETPGLGDKIEIIKNNWILSFNNRSLDDPERKKWKVKKDGGVFDQFTGATITPRAVVRAVYKALDYYDDNKNKLFLEQSQYNNLGTRKK